MKVVSNGVVPTSPVFFFDVDTKNGYSLHDITRFIETKRLRNADVYRTKNGWHIVSETSSWDESQRLLNVTKKAFSESDYIRNCRKLRLRVSAKWDEKTGEIVNPEPTLLCCRCEDGHKEKRLGKTEMYVTFEGERHA